VDRDACILALPSAALCGEETPGAHVLVLKSGEAFPVGANIVAQLRGPEESITVVPHSRFRSFFGFFTFPLANFAARVCEILDRADDNWPQGDPPAQRVGFGIDPKTIVVVARNSEAQEVAQKLKAALRAFAAAVQDEAGEHLGGHTPVCGVKVAMFDSPSEVALPCVRTFSMVCVRHDALNYTSITLNFAPALAVVLFSDERLPNNIVAERGDADRARLAFQRWALADFASSLGYEVNPLLRDSPHLTRTPGWDGAYAKAPPRTSVHFADAPADFVEFERDTTVTVLPDFGAHTDKSRKRKSDASPAA
jgi:hypothetical protein